MTVQLLLTLALWLLFVSVFLLDGQLILIALSHRAGGTTRQAVLTLPLLFPFVTLLMGTPLRPYVGPVVLLAVIGHLVAHMLWVRRVGARLVAAPVGLSTRVDELCRQWGARAPARVMVDPSVAVGPAVFGLLRQTLVLTPAVLAAPAEEQQVILAHELAHVARRDSLRLWLAGIGATLLGWHPVARRNIAALRLEIELTADEQAAEWLGDGHRYAQVLGRWGLKQAGAPAPGWGAALAGQPAALVVRMQNLVDERRPVSHLWASRFFGRSLASRRPRVAGEPGRIVTLTYLVLGGTTVGYLGLFLFLAGRL